MFSSSLLRTLTSCSVLTQQPAFKTAILDLIQQKYAMVHVRLHMFLPLAQTHNVEMRRGVRDFPG